MTAGYPEGTMWAVILAAGLGTLALRLSFILLFGRLDDVPPSVRGVLRFVPPAVLAALVVPSVLALSAGPLALTYQLPKLVAAALAAVVAHRTENVPATIAVGMVALWVLQALT